MKIALVHDWLTGMRGGERCLEVFCELFPDAPLYTLLYCPGAISPTIEKHPIHTSFIQRLPFSKEAYRYYLPLFPRAIESFNLSGYDLILTSSHCVAKGVRVPKGACHIAYIHTPMRYIWDQHEAYFGQKRANLLVRQGMRIFRPWLKRWDAASNDHIDACLTNSHYVAKRILTFYNRQAEVIYPPVDFYRFSLSQREAGFYLMVTAFVPYKQVDMAIAAFNQLRLPLKIIGAGPEERRLREMSSPLIEFLGYRDDAEVTKFYSACRALIFPGEEDFGIVPLEAMACGKPVIAYGRGGVTETVIPLNTASGCAEGSRKDDTSPTGLFFYDQTPESLMEAVRLFERHQYQFDPIRIREHVKPFDKARFKDQIRASIDTTYQAFQERDHA